jgi:lipopolysaccharide/colanic/teichoic acid biosynthesis glycosyltransferase
MIRPRSKESVFRVALAAGGDVAIAGAALAAAVLLRRNVPLQFTKALLPAINFPLDPLSFFLVTSTLIAALALSGFYRQRLTPRGKPRLAVALLMRIVLLTTAATFVARPVPRTILVAIALVEAALIPLWRLLLQSALPIRPRQTILFGSPAEVANALGGLDLTVDPRLRVVGWAGQERASLSVPYLGAITDAGARARLHEVEEVICAGSARERLDLLRVRGPRGFLLLASHADALLASSTLGWIGDQPLVQVAVGCGIGFQAGIKRTLDLVISGALLVLTLPLWLIAAVAVWLEDGSPVLIRQARVGLGGVPFPMWKLRSMRDGEVTRVGSLLRRYHVDELAQLLNVLAGDMSLVGPRPERPDIAHDIQRELPDFDLRCLVRPGIAGLAQVSAEYDSDPEVKLRYDLMYMCDWSLMLDLRLLLHSVSTSLSGSGV